MVKPNREAVKYCPFCGSGQIIHVSGPTFYCGFGLNATEEQIVDFLSKGGRSCGRNFAVYFRCSGSEKTKAMKVHWQKITQALFQQGRLVPPRRIPVKLGRSGRL